MLGLPVTTLQDWRATDVGPPYIRLNQSTSGQVRYRICDVQAWQKSRERVIPAGWQPTGTLPGESVPSDRVEWMPPGQAAIAIGIRIPTLTAWSKRAVGLPFVSIGGRGQHKYVYDRSDVEAFISRRKADPSIVPVIETKPRKDPRTPEERYRMLVEVLKGMGTSDEEIRRLLGHRFPSQVKGPPRRRRARIS